MDAMSRVRVHPLWENNPYIRMHFDDRADRLIDCGGHRPYIAQKLPERWVWREYEATPAEIFLTVEEKRFGRMVAAKNMVIIENTLKPKASPNKAWVNEYWIEVVEWLRQWGFMPVTIGPQSSDERKATSFDGVSHITTVNLRLAAAVMRQAVAYVGVEGFLHHLAAATNRPAVVVMGGYIGPKNTGYALDHHRYLTGGVTACGSRFVCEHCVKAMRSIKPSNVTKALQEVLNR